MSRTIDTAADRTAGVMLATLAVSVAASTLVHHRWPGLLAVPPLDGVPASSPGAMLALDLVVVALALPCFVHAWVRHGHLLATAFLVGSFVFTGLEETMWILLGRFASTVGPAAPGGTYYFTRGALWFLETPVTACVGWFLLAYATTWVAELVHPHAGIATQAAVAGLLAVDLDLWIDPVQTHPALRSWVWADQPGGLWLFSIPATNFIGWFLLIFLFALVFDRLPGWTRRTGPARATARFFAVLVGLEVAIFLFFSIYGLVEQTLVRPKLNVTGWGL